MTQEKCAREHDKRWNNKHHPHGLRQIAQSKRSAAERQPRPRRRPGIQSWREDIERAQHPEQRRDLAVAAHRIRKKTRSSQQDDSACKGDGRRACERSEQQEGSQGCSEKISEINALSGQRIHAAQSHQDARGQYKRPIGLGGEWIKYIVEEAVSLPLHEGQGCIEIHSSIETRRSG
jgi:hypothetical protein